MEKLIRALWVLPARTLRCLYQVYYRTIRLEVLNEKFAPYRLPKGRNMIYVFWHSKSFLILPHCRSLRIGILTLLDAKNLFYDELAKSFSYQTLPVTSFSTATKQLLQFLKSGASIGLAVDGPYGPAGVIKPGAYYLSRMTGIPIVAIDVSAHKKFGLFWRWDGYVIPHPFTKAAIRLSDPLEADGLSESDYETQIRPLLGSLH